jgi:hypothetical protein
MEVEGVTYNPISTMIFLKICTMKDSSEKDDININFILLSFNVLFYRFAWAHLPLSILVVYALKNPFSP